MTVPCPACVDGILDDATCDNCRGFGVFEVPTGMRPDFRACPPQVHAAIKAHAPTWARMQQLGVASGLDHRNCPCGGTMCVAVEEVSDAAA